MRQMRSLRKSAVVMWTLAAIALLLPLAAPEELGLRTAFPEDSNATDFLTFWEVTLAASGSTDFGYLPVDAPVTFEFQLVNGSAFSNPAIIEFDFGTPVNFSLQTTSDTLTIMDLRNDSVAFKAISTFFSVDIEIERVQFHGKTRYPEVPMPMVLESSLIANQSANMTQFSIRWFNLSAPIIVNVPRNVLFDMLVPPPTCPNVTVPPAVPTTTAKAAEAGMAMKYGIGAGLCVATFVLVLVVYCLVRRFVWPRFCKKSKKKSSGAFASASKDQAVPTLVKSPRALQPPTSEDKGSHDDKAPRHAHAPNKIPSKPKKKGDNTYYDLADLCGNVPPPPPDSEPGKSSKKKKKKKPSEEAAGKPKPEGGKKSKSGKKAIAKPVVTPSHGLVTAAGTMEESKPHSSGGTGHPITVVHASQCWVEPTNPKERIALKDTKRMWLEKATQEGHHPPIIMADDMRLLIMRDPGTVKKYKDQGFEIVGLPSMLEGTQPTQETQGSPARTQDDNQITRTQAATTRTQVGTTKTQLASTRTQAASSRTQAASTRTQVASNRTQTAATQTQAATSRTQAPTTRTQSTMQTLANTQEKGTVSLTAADSSKKL